MANTELNEVAVRSFHYVDDNNDVVLIDLDNASDQFNELMQDFGCTYARYNTHQYGELSKSTKIWELKLPFLKDELTLVIADDSSGNYLSFSYQLYGNDSGLTETHLNWILDYVVNVILYQDTSGMCSLKEKLLLSEEYTKK